MRTAKFFISLVLILVISVTKSQVIYNVTQTSFGPGPGTFQNAIFLALNDVSNGQHAIININAPGLIQIPTGAGPAQVITLNGSSDGTLTIQKDPSLLPGNDQGFLSSGSGPADFLFINFQTPNSWPNNITKVKISNLKFEKFTNAITLSTVEETTIDGCLFLDNIESIHVENSISTAITANTFSESPNNQKQLLSGVHVFCLPNTITISGNKFQMAYPSTLPFSVGHNSFVGVNINSNSLANNVPVFLGISTNTFIMNYKAIHSDLKPVSDLYNPGLISVSISSNKFTDNKISHCHIINPLKKFFFSGNTFGSCNGNSFFLEFKPISNSNINNFGLDFIGPNSLNLTGVNYLNSNLSNATGLGGAWRSFLIKGQPNTLNVANNSVNIIGHKLNHGVTIGNVKKVNIQESALNQTTPFPVIDQTGGGLNEGNEGIAPPLLSSAVQTSCNQLTVDYYLTGNQHSNTNAPLVVEFFVCDLNGGIQGMIGRQTITNVNSNQLTANFNLNFSFTNNLKLGATVTSNGNSATTGLGTSEVSYIPVNVNYTMPTIPNGCLTTAINMSVCPSISTTSYMWNFGDGSLGTGAAATHSYINPGNYNVTVTVTPLGGSPMTFSQQVTINNCQPPQPCSNCIGSFAPDPGEYVLSVWARENVNPQPLTYTNPSVVVTFANMPWISYSFIPDVTRNKIIEGWQKIEGTFNIPMGTPQMSLALINAGGAGAPDVFFDDIRIFPKDGQMKTYVYDPLSMRLSAILDENNYATFYEYDEEGKLIRIKKETEKGIMTIQESREGSKKQ